MNVMTNVDYHKINGSAFIAKKYANQRIGLIVIVWMGARKQSILMANLLD
jgi:hypothetical protein